MTGNFRRLQPLCSFCFSSPDDSGEALLSLHALEQLAHLLAPKTKMQLVYRFPVSILPSLFPFHPLCCIMPVMVYTVNTVYQCMCSYSLVPRHSKNWSERLVHTVCACAAPQVFPGNFETSTPLH